MKKLLSLILLMTFILSLSAVPAMAEGEKVIAVQSIPGDVVENSRRTSEARSLERKALREQEEAAKANAAPEAQQEEPSNDAAAEGESSDGNEDNGDI